MEPITGLLRISGGSIVLLFCLYSTITLYWYHTENDATTDQHPLGTTDTTPTEDTSTASQRTPWAADTHRTENDPRLSDAGDDSDSATAGSISYDY